MPKSEPASVNLYAGINTRSYKPCAPHSDSYLVLRIAEVVFIDMVSTLAALDNDAIASSIHYCVGIITATCHVLRHPHFEEKRANVS